MVKRKIQSIKLFSKKYTGNLQRADRIRKSLLEYVTDINSVIGLGFCVSIDHAKYMADAFTQFGIPSTHLSALIVLMKREILFREDSVLKRFTSSLSLISTMREWIFR